MKKLKRIWQENSVLIVLLMILIACIIAITVVVVNYFVGDSETKYGDRLDGIEAYPFNDTKQEEIINKIKEDEKVIDATVRTSGKIIYLSIKFTPETTLVEGESKALASLEYFGEDLLEFYDIEYLISAEATENTDGFHIIGSHNVSGSGGIVWNNNTAVIEE